MTSAPEAVRDVREKGVVGKLNFVTSERDITE